MSSEGVVGRDEENLDEGESGSVSRGREGKREVGWDRDSMLTRQITDVLVVVHDFFSLVLDKQGSLDRCHDGFRKFSFVVEVKMIDENGCGWPGELS